MMDTLQKLKTEAARLHDAGFNIVPMVPGKKAAVKWRRFQSERQARADMLNSLDFPNVCAIATVCGFGGLGARDFDTMPAFNAWREKNPALAKELPSYLTNRGGHVWFSPPTSFKTKVMKDGELRGNGLVIVPPSQPLLTGRAYRWIVPFNHKLPEVDPAVFCPNTELVTERNRDSTETNREDLRETEEISSVHLNSSQFLSVTNTVEQAIVASLPEREGERHYQLFEFARRLRAMPEYASAPMMALQPIVRQWFDRALPVIATQDWGTTWREFLNGWERIQTPFGANPVDDAFHASCGQTCSPALAKHYDDPHTQRMYLFCQELAKRTAPNPFYLSADVAAKLFRTDKMAAWRCLRQFVQEDVLEVVEKHTPYRATRYRFKGAPM